MRRGVVLPRWTVLSLVGLFFFLAACGDQTGKLAGHDSTGGSGSKVGQSSAASEPSRWVLSWDDEFNGRGRPRYWQYEIGGDGWSHRQVQWNGFENAKLNGHGQLVITASRDAYGEVCWYGPCQYSAARIQTTHTFSQTYGRFEARIKLPLGRGLWSGFWMEGADIGQVGWPQSGEIDVVEDNGRQPYVVEGFAHAPKYNHAAYRVIDEPISAGYHVYGVDWTPQGITWTLDGRAYSYIREYKGWPFSRPFFLILDVAVGGSYPGPPTSSTRFPARMLVDWVRVYRQVR